VSRVQLNPEALQWRLLEGEVLAIDLANSRYLAVNPSGALLWPLLADGATEEELSKALGEHFGLEPQRAKADVEGFLRWLDSQSLLLRDEG
jgi:hypothetical protein